MHDRARGSTSATIARSDVPSARFSGMPSHPASSGTITSPPPMPEESARRSRRRPRSRRGSGPSPVAGSRRRGSRAPRMMPTACQPSRRAVTSSRRCVSTSLVSQRPDDGAPMPGPTIQAPRGGRARRPAGRRARPRARSGRSPAAAWRGRRSAAPRAGLDARASSRCRRRPRTAPTSTPGDETDRDRRARSGRRHRAAHRSSSAARASTSRSPR